ncbi:titin isoform X2 [Fundulus heteroclitus]|uniref:titin isoform X2 n=1 Tax=Fundulus heteroclitus TaxID=8078 RepID=UPI00165B2389|nr:titin isoform X2 [Fundulus heteroclitus]
MTSVEKRRSSRRSSGHRKHSDGGFSDTSSGGSFLDETDREVSNLTDRAFRSLCIGDEAVYNDSDLSWSSPSAQSDRQLAFCRDSEEREREDRKRAAQEDFNLRVQRYEQDWITGGTYGAAIHRDQQWGAYGERTQGTVSATFQHSLVETSQLDTSLREKELSFLSNGTTELSSQQRRSHSRVSSLIRAYGPDGHRDGGGTADKIRERDGGTSWDKSALMSIQRELSEFSYQQNFNSHHFHPAGPFSCQDANFYSSESQTLAQISHGFMRSSHIKHSMSSQANCSSNFFIHSEFSPFKLWRDYNRFPFQQAQASGFMHYSEFPKWYRTPMYNEPSLENQAHSHQRDARNPRNYQGQPVPLTAPRSVSTSSQVQRASAVEKRCESELAVHHPHRKWTQNLGTNKLPSHRPSTASPSTEMSRRVRDTISSVKALQQKVKMMSEQDLTNEQGVFGRNESWVHSSNNALSLETNCVRSNTANPFRAGQELTPSVHQHQDAETSRLHQHEVSPQPVEHAPVRAESRGATPDIRRSSYRARATSLLFNLKDNRKRVKSTYSPTKFKGLDTPEKTQQSSVQEPPEAAFTDSDVQGLQPEAPRRTNAAVNQYQPPGPSITPQTSHPVRMNTAQYPENTASSYNAAPMGHGSRFSGFEPSHYTNNQRVGNGQHPDKTLASITPYRQDIHRSEDKVQQPYAAVDTARLNVDNNQHRQHLMGKANTASVFNETTGRVLTKLDTHEQVQENKYDYKNVSTQDSWRQVNSQDPENTHLKINISPLKQENASLIESSKQQNMHGGKREHVKDVNLMQNYNRFTDQHGRGQQDLYFTSDKPITMIKTGPIKQNIPVLNEKIQNKTQFEKKNPTIIPGNASTVTMTNQVKDAQNVDSKGEQVLTSHKKTQYPQAELAKTQQKSNPEPSKAESAGFILAGQTGFETVKTQESKSEPTELQNIGQVKESHIIKAGEGKDQHKEKLGDKCFQTENEKQIKAEKERAQKLTDEPINVTEKVPKKPKTEQAEAEKLKEECIKTKLAKTETPERVSINQVKHEQANGLQAEEKQRRTETAEGEAEKIKTEKVKAEKIGGEKREQMKESETKARDTKRMEVEVLEIRADHMKVEDVREARDEKDPSPARQKYLEKASSSTGAEKAKLEENLEKKEPKQSKTENLLSAKLSAKVAATQQVRQEPDRVEQVKTELAKARAELARIKEKMRGEQKEKVRNILFSKEEATWKSIDPIDTNTGRNVGSINQSHPAEMQTHAVTDDYQRLREKYGFTQAASANSTKASVTENVPSNDLNDTAVGTGNKSIEEPCLKDLFLTSGTDDKVGVRGFKGSEEKGSPCDHNKSLNEPQFSGSHCLHTNPYDKANRENVAKKGKDNSGQRTDVIKDTASLQKDSVTVKQERKSNDQRFSTGKDTPPTALPQKAKAQTKQEILTSKIKAHAEKEISAIKEKGFALPEGFIGKGSTKQFTCGQSVNVRQRPSSQEVPKSANKITPKHQVEPPGAEKEAAECASSLSSETVSGHAAEKPTKTIQPSGASVSRTMQTESEITSISQQKEANPPETSAKQNWDVQQVANDEALSKTRDLTQDTSTSKPVTTEETETKEAARKDSGLVDCVNQKEPPVTDDTVQIMGIMVTVVERKPTVSNVPQNSNAENQTTAAERECNKSDSGQEEVLVKANDSKQSQSMVKEDEAALGKDTSSQNLQEALTWEALNRETTAEMADLQLNSCTVNTELRRMRQPEATALSDSDEMLAQTQPVLHQTVAIQEETKDVTIKTPMKDWSKSFGQTEGGDEENQQKVQKPPANEISREKVNKAENDLLVKDDMKTGKDFSKSSSKDGHCAPYPEHNICPSTLPSSLSKGGVPNNLAVNETRHVSQNLQSTETHTEGNGQEATSVHIDNIAIRAEPVGDKKDHVEMVEHRDLKTSPSNMESPYEQQQAAASSSEGKATSSTNGHCSENLIQANTEQNRKDSLEEKLAVQYVLSSVRKLSDSLKAIDKQNNTNAAREPAVAEDKKSEPGTQLVEAEYFQVQGLAETNDASHGSMEAGNDSKAEDVLKVLPSKTVIGNRLHKEEKSDAFVFTVDPSERIADLSSLTNIQGENLTRKHLETEDNTVAPKQSGGFMDSWNNNKKGESGQSNPSRKHNEENQCDSSTMEREHSSDQHLKNTHLAKERAEVKPKLKERTSAIPEISALADYARLKVIVSEDKEVPQVHQFPPNKKEGFFPLIQTRHSRCPVFTDDPQDPSVKTRSVPNKTEISATASKEPKSLVFPIMEKEHQRTGMFKLADKERQEKMNAKMKICLLDKNESQTDTNNLSKAKTELFAQASEGQQMRLVEVEQQREAAREEQQRRESEEQQKRAVQMTLSGRLAEEEQRPQDALNEQQTREAEKQQRRASQLAIQGRIAEDQQRKFAHAEHQRRAAEEQQRRLAEEERQRKAADAEQQRRAAEEQQRRLAEEERQRKAAEAEHQRRAAEEQQRRHAEEEQQRKAAHAEQRRREAGEQQRRLAEEEQQRKAAHAEHQRRAVEEQQRRLAEEEQQRKAVQAEHQRRAAEEQQRRLAEEEQQRKAADAEQQRRAAEEQQRRLAEEERQRKAAHAEQQRKAAEEQQRRLAEEEQQRKAAHAERQRRAVEEQQRRLAEEEQQRKAAEAEHQRRAAEEQQRRLAEEEQQRKAAHAEHQRKAAEEQQRRLAEEEQQRKAAHAERQRRAVEEQQRRLAEEEQQRKAAEAEHQRRAAEEQQRRLAEEEQQRKAAEAERQRRAVEEQQRRLAEEEQQRKAADAERQRRAAEEQQRRLAEEEQQRKAAKESQQRREIEEQQRRAAHIELQRQLAAEHQRRQDAHEEQQRKTEEHERTIAQLEQQMSISEVKQQRRAAEEQQRRFKEGPQVKKSAHEEWERTIQEKQREAEQQQCTALQNDQQRKATEEKQRRASQLQQREAHEQQMMIVHEEKQRREAEEHQWRVAQKNQQKILSPEEQQRRELDEQERKGAHDEQQRKAAQGKQQSITSLRGEQRQVKHVKEQTVAPIQKETKGRLREDINVALSPEKESIKQIDLNKDNNMQDQAEDPVNERPMGEDKTTSQKRLESENMAAEEEKVMREQRVERHVKHESVEAQETLTTNDRQAKKAEGDERLASLKEKARYLEMEMENRAAQRTDALQYYAITSTSRERKPRERQLSSPLQPLQQNKKVTELESPNDSLFPTRPHRSPAAASPAPSLPRSNTSSPALGVKPLMFRVKDNTMRGSSFTKSVKPRFHRNFGEDFSTLGGGSDKTEEDQDMIRRNAGTPLNRFSAISESAAFFSPSSSQDYSNSLTHLRPYSRRSMVMDDDESRSIISNMSEDVESFATSAADLTDLHGQFDLDRPESACSFSSDASRSLGKPPVVPPKSEKALRRAQRLTSRRMRKELSKAAAPGSAGVGKEAAGFPSSSSASDEVRSTNHHAVASPHFSPPVTFALAPAPGSSLPSSHTNPKPSHCSFHASPHATGPISIPSPSPHAGSAVSLHASGPASKHAALQTVAHVSSSPTLHHVHPPAPPVTQYHVESTSYPQSYPLTQRKVLQDLGSGQYFVVDVPVQVKTKTFFDPETGKYVQLNVRQTAPSISQPPLQQAYQQPQVPPQMPLASVASVASKPFRFYQGYHDSSQHYQTAVVNPAPPSSSAVPATPHQNPQTSREAHSYGNPVPGVDQNSEGRRYSPEKAPYMDTVSDVTKTHNLVNSVQEISDPFLDCDTDSQLGRSSVCENERSANSEYQPRDIIAISELEDFMEVSDW